MITTIIILVFFLLFSLINYIRVYIDNSKLRAELKKAKEWPELSIRYISKYKICIKQTNYAGDTNEHYLSDVVLSKLEHILCSQPDNKPHIYQVLGMMPSTNRDDVLAAYKRMCKVYHPDVGGSSNAFNLLNKAKDIALSKCN